jgi:hypothetical protein
MEATQGQNWVVVIINIFIICVGRNHGRKAFFPLSPQLDIIPVDKHRHSQYETASVVKVNDRITAQDTLDTS